MDNINGNKLDSLILHELKIIMRQNPPLFDDVSLNVKLFSSDETAAGLEEDTIRKKVHEIDLGIQNLILAISKSTNSEAVEVLTKRMEELTCKKEELQNKLLNLQKNENREYGVHDLHMDIDGLVKFDDYAWELMSIKDKRMMMRSVIEKISWDGVKLIMTLY
jgi:site-specific DNA recombinase